MELRTLTFDNETYLKLAIVAFSKGWTVEDVVDWVLREALVGISLDSNPSARRLKD